jgi:hypothetical protein
MLGAKLAPHKSRHVLIRALKSNHAHLKRNKLDEKLGRRDIQFYDLYKLNEPAEDVRDLNLFKMRATDGEVFDPSLYSDIEVNDFNLLFVKESTIANQFGESICV